MNNPKINKSVITELKKIYDNHLLDVWSVIHKRESKQFNLKHVLKEMSEIEMSKIDENFFLISILNLLNEVLIICKKNNYNHSFIIRNRNDTLKELTSSFSIFPIEDLKSKEQYFVLSNLRNHLDLPLFPKQFHYLEDKIHIKLDNIFYDEEFELEAERLKGDTFSLMSSLCVEELIDGIQFCIKYQSSLKNDDYVKELRKSLQNLSNEVLKH